jgi:hypothetical protein
MRRLAIAAFVVASAALVSPARADDKQDPSGTWKWSVTRNGQTRETTLKLKMEGDKLVGAIPGRDGQETKIEEGTCKDGEVSFQVTRERQGQKFVVKYKGKVTGDTIKGTIETERDGKTQSREWEAKRSKD